FTYDPRGVAGFESLHVGSTTTDSFTFTVTDSHGQSSTATETITISVNDPGPVASNGSVSTEEDTGKTGTLTFTAAEPSDTGDHLTATTGTFTTADGGSVTIFANGTFSYDPTHVAAFETLHVGSTTTDSFTSLLAAHPSASSTATETITVMGDLPTAPSNLSVTPTGPHSGTFTNGDAGTLEVKATFDGNAS